MFEFNGILIGQYRPLDTPIHRLDPRTKILWSLAIVSLVAFTLNPVLYASLTVYLVILLLLARLSVIRLAPIFKASVLMFVVTFALHILFSEPAGRIFYEVRGIAISSHGLENAVLYSYRIFLLLMAAALVSFTTSPIDLTDGLLKLLGPLRALRVPVSEIGMMVFVALRFIPILSEEGRTIRAAQLSRGLKQCRGPIAKVRSIVPLILPLFAGAVRRADHLAIAIESRGYRRGVNRTSLRESHLRIADWIFVGLLVVIASGHFLFDSGISA